MKSSNVTFVSKCKRFFDFAGILYVQTQHNVDAVGKEPTTALISKIHPVNQHYVPEFYLKNFSQNGKQIFVYDKVIKKSFSSGISSVASQQSFYNNSKNKSIEDEIADMESKTGSVLKKLILSLNNNEFSKIDQIQKNILIEFIWMQMNRTLESRIHFASIKPHLYNKLTNVPFEIDVNELLSQIETTDNHIEFLRSSSKNSLALETFGSRNFIIVKNQTQIDFLTSDEPVIRYLHSEIESNIYEVFLPITPKLGLWVIAKNIYKELDDADGIIYPFENEENILFYNYLHVYRSTRQIFSFSGDCGYVHQIFNQNPNFGNFNKQRLG